MAGQGLFLRTLNLTGRCRLLCLNNRVSHVNLQPSIMGLKQQTKDMLQSLKIPEKPKKPISPYFKFAMDHRPSIQKEHPEWKQTEIMKKCGEDWKNSHTSIKEKYQNDFKSEMVVYAEKHLKYSAKLTDEQRDALKAALKEKQESKKKRAIRKLNKETDKPKRPLTSFMRFLMDQTKDQHHAIKDIMPQIKERWANLPEGEKQRYRNDFLQDKQHYETEMKQWENKMLQEGHENLVRVSSLHQKRPSRLLKEKKDKPQ